MDGIDCLDTFGRRCTADEIIERVEKCREEKHYDGWFYWNGNADRETIKEVEKRGYTAIPRSRQFDDGTCVYNVYKTKPSKVSFDVVEDSNYFFRAIYGFLNRETLVDILEDLSLAYHLWHKYMSECGYNAQVFYSGLDPEVKVKIIRWYNDYIALENPKYI